MRVFRLNDSDAYAGRTALQAVRAAMADTGLSFGEIVDRDCFAEIPRDQWSTIILHDLEDESLKRTVSLESVMSGVTEPQMVITANW